MGFSTMVIPTIQSNSEPFLQEKQRFTLDPIHKDIWEMYKKQQALFWTAEEITFQKILKIGITSVKIINGSLNIFLLFSLEQIVSSV